MPTRHANKLVKILREAKFLVLLLLLLGMFAAHNIGGLFPRGSAAFALGYLLLLFFAVLALNHHSLKTMILAAVLGLIDIAFSALEWLRPGGGWGCYSDAADVIFLAFVAVVLLLMVLKAHRVTKDTLLGAICVYLLMGGAWAFGYSLVERFYPGSFKFPDPMQATDSLQAMDSYYRQLFYFSFVTLCTIGYGDMVPQSPPARSLAILEALFGQLYLVVMVGRLVSLNLAHEIELKTKPLKELEHEIAREHHETPKR